MTLLQALLFDYAQTMPSEADRTAAERFVAWAERDLVEHPIGSAQQEIGRCLLTRTAPRSDATLAIGRELATPSRVFVAVGMMDRAAAWSPVAAIDDPAAVSCFPPAGSK